MSNNLENNSYVLAIPSDNISPIGSNPFYYEFNSKTLSGHGDIFKLFVLRYMININIPASDGYFWGKELADKGVFSVIKEDDEAYLFIPKTLTVKQADWLIENKEYLKSFPMLEAGVFLDDGSYQEMFCSDINDQLKKAELVESIYKIVDSKINDKNSNDMRRL